MGAVRGKNWLGVCASVLLGVADAGAVQTVRLPAESCPRADTIYADGFGGAPSNPSNGSGGAIGSIMRTVHVGGLGTGAQNYYLYVPSDYTPTRAWPFILVLHGTAPYPDTYAATTRNDWAAAASAGHFIVAAATADETYFEPSCNCTGVTWKVPPSSGPTDYDEFAAIRGDLEGAYNIERTRIYVWGFSAGAHVAHDLGVNTYSSAFNASTLAAYGVSSGDLAGLACQGLSDAQCSQALAALPRKIPLDIHVGTNDSNIYPYAQSDHSRFLAEGWVDKQTIFYTTFVDGHVYYPSQLSDIWHNLCPSAVIP